MKGNDMKNDFLRYALKSSIVAAAYILLTYISYPLAFNDIQFRVSEVLILLVFISPKYIFSLAIGTFIANLASPFGLADAVMGTAVSICSMLLMIKIREIFGTTWASMFGASFIPALLHGLYVPFLMILLEPNKNPWVLFIPMASSVAVGEFVVVALMGVPIMNLIINNAKIWRILTF